MHASSTPDTKRPALPLLLWLSLLPAPLLAATEMQSFTLAHKSAAQLAPTLQPLLDYGETVVPSGNQLIIKADSSKMGQFAQLISQLDVAPHRLIITVVQGRNLTSSELNTTLADSHPIDPNDASASQPAGHYYSAQSQKYGGQTQRLQALDGTPVSFQVGDQQQIQSQAFVGFGLGGGMIGGANTQYVPTSTGFKILPRVQADGIVVDVAPWSEQMNQVDQRTVHTESASTTLRLQPGKWADLAGELNNSQGGGNGNAGHSYRAVRDNNQIYIRVDDLDAR